MFVVCLNFNFYYFVVTFFDLWLQLKETLLRLALIQKLLNKSFKRSISILTLLVRY